MQIGLIDQVSKPLGKIGRELNSVTKSAQSGMKNMAAGGAGLLAAGFAIQNALMPAIEMDRKMGELASLGTAEDAMNSLKKTAMGFAVEYGKSAEEFVEASYDIQSAIAGLKGDELARFTKASGVLAAATKSDTKTITNYMGTMYGIFKTQADAMGKGEWVDQVAGQTAKAVQMFKTTGSEMSGAFSRLGADATSVGISMNEQMAVLGTLQATMSGSEAGTKYRAFLKGTAKAQKALNLTFTDAHGQMLPMVSILEKIKGKYGDTIDVAESAELTKAFGTAEASGMIKLLMADIDGLGSSVEELGKVKGIDIATQMAKKQTDQWERLEQAWYVVRAAIGGAILPAFASIAQAMSDGSVILMQYMNEYPQLTKYIGYALMAIVGLGGAVAVFSLLAGVGSFITAGFTLAMATLKGVVFLASSAFSILRTVLFTVAAAIWANPIMWLVGIIGLLIAGVAAVIYYWDDLKKSFGDWAVFETVRGMLNDIIDVLNMIPGVNIEPLTAGNIEVPKQQLNEEITRVAANEKAASPYSPTAQWQGGTSSYLQGQKQTNVPVGGIRSQMTNNNNGKTVSYGDVTVIQPQQNMSLTELDERMGELAHG